MANESNQSNSEIKEFFVQHGSKVLVALAIVLVVVAGVVQFKDSRKAAAVEQAELLGTGLTYLYVNDKDNALTEFEAKINSGKLSGLAMPRQPSLPAISSTRRVTLMVLLRCSRSPSTMPGLSLWSVRPLFTVLPLPRWKRPTTPPPRSCSRIS